MLRDASTLVLGSAICSFLAHCGKIPQFVHSPIAGRLDHFQVEVRMNKATVNIV